MLTLSQKEQIIKDSLKKIQDSQSLIFVDFSGVKNQDFQGLRSQVKSAGGQMQVIKKKLLRLVFEKSGLNFNPEDFELQLATVFSPTDIYTIAAAVGRAETAKIIGGFDLENKQFIPAEEAIRFSRLPSREVLLGQLAGGLISPIRAFLYILSERSKKTA